MFNLGFPELVVIFTLALLIFGPRKLPEIGRSLGKSLNEFKRATNELKRTWESEVQAEEESFRRVLESEDRDLRDAISREDPGSTPGRSQSEEIVRE